MKKIISIIPFITAILFIAGYVYNYSLYSHFGIDIFTFLTSGELILSFIPIMMPLCLAVIYLIYMSFRLDSQSKTEKKEDTFIKTQDLSFWGPFKDLIKASNKDNKTNIKRSKKWIYYTTQISSRLLMLTLLLVPTCLYIYAYIKRLGYPIYQPTMFFIISIIWIIIITYVIYNFFEKKYQEISSFMGQIVLFIGFLLVIYLFNTYKAFSILERKPFYSVKLKLQEITIQTNDNLVFISKTKEYYFLRDIDKKENIIINEKDVSMVSIKPINNR